MGCSTSKLDDLPAVALCRDRCSFLEAAIHQRYALSEAHVSYTQSLKAIAHSLHQFINHHDRNDDDDSDSPKKAKPKMDSGSGHLDFDSDSDDDDDIDSLHSSPLHHHLDDDSNSKSYLHMNYMKNSSIPPSVVYEQRPVSPQRVYFGESSSTSEYYNPYLNSRLPPAPPSPPREKVWDFLNPFDTYYTPYTPSRDSRELREELGVPDLEEDDEVVKEVHGKQKFVAVPATVEEPIGKSGASTSGGGGGGQASLYQTRPSVLVEKEEMEHEVHVVEKKVVEDGGGGDEARKSNAAVARGGGGGGGVRRGVPEVVKEIEVQFLRAAESGNEIAVMLEVGKHPYGRKHVSSKKLHEVTPSPSVVSSAQSSTFKKAKAEASSSVAAPTYADIEAELALRSRNLSLTLHKLHLWEKKLYDEVKAEEKLRVNHEKKLRKLKRMDERGAEDQKVDSTRKLVRSMSSKIRIAIQVVDKISITINKIRDEELWLQLNELIQGLSKMWKSMLECHQSQCEAIKEARGLGPIRASKKLGDNHLEVTRTLGLDLINWIVGFSSWVSAQKGFVRELNSWLMKCLFYEPEETPDGIVPFSPGRIGAPLIFVICNQWEQALDRISEKEVVEAIRRFTTSVLHLWEQDRLATRERMMGHGDPRNMDREELRIQREIQELEMKMVLVGPGEDNIVYQSDTSNESLQGSLQRIFEAMERFTEESMKAYVDLLHRAEDDECGSRETDEED